MGFAKTFFKIKKKKRNSDNGDILHSNNRDYSITESCSSSFRSHNTNSTEELEQVFNKFDVNGDGKISSSELGSIFGSLGQEVSEEELGMMMKEVDADGDGFIDLEEFIVLNTKGIDSDEVLNNLKEAFSIYDADGNGSISAQELYMVMKSLGDDCSLDECKKMISGVDKDGDGTINFEEFKVMMMMGAQLLSLGKE
ncbi:putative calcium-binding protein CML25 [Silene latifolia]|uniref:putative calcium-binding protein CML25 n=1 Tax=Silene latifolia TaxID=37657 RepID=UPI003D76B12F